MVKSRQFTRCMGRWLMALVLVMLTSLATKAASVEVWTSDVAGAPGSTVVIPVYVTCDVDITAFMINFSTDLGVTYSNVVFSDRINPSANPGFGATNGNLIVYNTLGNNESSLDAGEGLVARIYLDIPDDADPGAYTMTLGNMQFMAVGTSGSANTIYVGNVHATLTVSGSEAYACYTPSNTTLTFYYDNQRSSRSGTTYDLNTGSNNPDWRNDGTYSNVTRVVFDPSFASVRPTTTVNWFYNMQNLESITGMKEYLNTSELTQMRSMFGYCEKLTSLDVSGFNTDKVTNMSYMFYYCSALTSLDLSSFNTSNVTEMSYMFRGCESLTSLDLSSFNTSNVTTMSYMFSQCDGLTSLDVSGFNTSNVTNMGDMFRGCESLTSLDLSSFNTSKVTKMSYMFIACSNLTTIYVGNSWSTAKVTNSDNMFYYCTSLVGGKGTTYNSSHVDAAYAHIDGGPSNPGYLSEKPKEAYACYTPGNTTLTFYYDNQRSSRSGTTYDLNTGSNNPGWYTDGTYSNVTRVVFDPSFANARPTTTYRWFYEMTKLTTITGIEYLNTSEVTNMSYMFVSCYKLTSVDVSHFNTSKVTDMSRMFYDCKALTSLDVSSFNTSKVTDMGTMFRNCSSLTSLDVSNFNTSNVTRMGSMFSDCSSLTSLNLGNFNTSKVTSMEDIFYNCSSLTSLDVSSFNTSNVTIMSSMFYNCSSLTSLDVSCFDTEDVYDMGYMFYGCSRLTSLDLSSFNTSKVTKMYNMFQNCSSLRTVYVDSGWSTAAVTNSSSMFYNCTRLVGGQGTTYNASHTDKAYAHIDGGSSNPGYFTARAEPYACYTPSNTTLTFYYDTQRSSRSGTTYDLNEGSNYPDWYQDGTNASVTKVVFNSSFASARPTSTFDWFYNMQNLQSITGIINLNTSKVTDMAAMFWGCTNLTSLDVSSFNTSNVTSMSFMFYDCSSLRSLDLSSFNTAKVIYMSNMFNNCQALTSLDVSSFNTSNVTDMSNMFTNCRNLTSLDVNSFNTSKVTDMNGMFANCWSLTSLNLSSFNTSKVTDMSYMFYDCCDLTTIYVGSEWSTVAVTSSSDMFWHCIRLVGGQGTTFDANHVDKAYAHIDGGPSNPGYMSQFMRGDVNHDGFVNVADVTALIQIILNSMPVDLAVADLSGDNNVNVADVTALIQIILNQ